MYFSSPYLLPKDKTVLFNEADWDRRLSPVQLPTLPTIDLWHKFFKDHIFKTGQNT